jgi:hypothetical protein
MLLHHKKPFNLKLVTGKIGSDFSNGIKQDGG